MLFRSFFRDQIEYLGMVFTPDHVGMDPIKVAGMTDWLEPQTLKETQSFLGFINFYQQFIQDFAKIARPLNDLTQKDTPFQWTATE